MNLISIRIITDDVDASAAFYERLTGVTAVRPTAQFAEIRTPSATLAIGHTATVALFGPGSARPADNHTAIIEFIVDDVDAEHVRLQADGVPVVQEPTTMPWGNRSLLLRDPDGTLVNLFTPVSAAAVAKFADASR
jgi:catechol 2,3-dioxygenase-like lactoylglutathione lyase family enzyme